ESVSVATTVSAQSWSIADVDLTSLQDGVLTVTSTTIDIAGNPATNTSTINKDTFAQITIEIEDGGDGTLNIEERNSVRLFGTVKDIEDGQRVVVEVTDFNDNKLEFEAIVVDGQWEVTGVDVSTWPEGDITATATAVDVAGNSSSAVSDVTTIDLTVPTIDIDTLTGFEIFDFRDGLLTSVQGTTTGVDQNLPVTVTISDGILSYDFQTNVENTGRWSLDSIDVSGLDSALTWTMTASVTNAIGNSVLDDMPTLVLPDAISLSETFVGIFGEDSATSTINIENAQFTFDDTQDALLLLESSGQSLSFTLSSDKQSLTVSRSGGDIVLEAKIIGSGEVDITLYKGLDSGTPGDTLLTELIIRGVQTDQDGTTEEVLAPLIIEVQDSPPLVFDDHYIGTESESITGNVLQNDADLDGGLQVRLVIIGNETQVVDQNAPAVFDLPEGKLFVFSNGQWVLQSSRDLDHSTVQGVEFTYVAGDGSTDYDSGLATIEIVDGETGTIVSDQGQVAEGNLTDNTAEGEASFTVSGGSDNPDSESIQFDPDTIATLEALRLTSGDSYIELEYTLSDDGKTITGLVGNTVILTVTLTAAAAGNDAIATTNIILHAPLNEAASTDIIYLPLRIKGQDTDGTALHSGEFIWQIKDGVNPQVTEGKTITINEDELGNGALTREGTFNLELGSDPLRSAHFDLSDFPNITSEGLDVVYTINPNGNLVTAYQEDASGDMVFMISFEEPSGTTDQEITYTFLMNKAIDQVNGTDQLNFPITVNDTDEDSASLGLSVTITDGSAGTIVVTDMEVTERPPASGVEVTDIDTAQVTVSASKDPIVDLILQVSTGDAVIDSNNNPLTHNGESIYWKNNGDGTYDGELANGTTVFNVTLPDELNIAAGESDNIEITFHLREQVDHDGDGQDNQLSLTLPIAAIDSDGTEQEAISTIVINDGLNPTFTVNGVISAIEDGLLDDNQDNGAENSPPTLTVTEGSDSFNGFIIDVNAFNTLDVKSAQQNVTLQEVNNDGWYIAVNEDNQEVFRVRLLDTGNVEFELSKPLDHELPATDLPNDTNIETLEFQVAATDFDNDVSDYQTLSVNITDDVPESRVTTVELVEGDDLTKNLLTSDYAGADGATITSIHYQGVDYAVNGSVTIELKYMPVDTDVVYGQLIVQADGTFKLTTKDFVDNDIAVTDSVDYTVVDTDGDTVVSTANLVLDDAQGILRVLDAVTKEDVETEINVTVILGDLDQNETVESISFTEESLNGGTLFLDGVELVASGGIITLLSDQLESFVGDIYRPNGTLTFLPPQHESNTTSTVDLDITATIKNGDGTSKILTNILNVSVLPVADTPLWNEGESQFEYNTIEDASDTVILDLKAELVDLDTSEELSFQITGIPEGITLYINDNLVKETKFYTQNQLDKITVVTEENLAGVFEFNITAVAIEQGNNFDQPTDETASTTRTVTVNVSPDADKPELSVRNIDGLEDSLIPLNEALKGSLTDNDGSETLYYEIVVPDGWSIQGTVVSESGNTYLVEAVNVENGEIQLIPKSDISSVTETLSIDVTAISRESTIDNLTPVNEEARSETKTININIKGVIDEPTVIDGGNGHWQFDSNAGDKEGEITAITPFDEDSLVALDFVVKTTDDDGSEVINILLTDIPDGVSFVDQNGNPIVLTIAEVDPDSGPVIQFDNALLAQTYIKLTQDFSGDFSLTVRAITTEPDGDTGAFDYTLKVDVAPVVDQSDGQVIASTGAEDRSIAIDLNLAVNSDIDGSEELVDYFIDGMDEGLTLYFDDLEQSIPNDGLNLNSLLDAESPTLEVLLTSGRITVKGDRDLSGDFELQLRYTVQDTSETGLTTFKELSGQAHVTIEGRVEYDTRLEATTQLLESTDGSAIDLSEAVWFVEEDVDGSEFLDYIVLEIPDGVNMIVEHPNGAAQNASGDWIIDAGGLTSDSIQDVMAMILKDATIRSPQNTDIVTIGVKALVLDDPDGAFITTKFDVRITGHDGGDGNCDEVGEPGDITNGEEIKFQEGETIDLSGLLNSDIADDPDNELSFYIPADSLPEDVYLEGDGIIVEYNNDGTVAGYSVSPNALSTLTLYGVDEDFAGCVEFTIVTIETSTCNGTSNETENTIKLDIIPVVDNFTVSVGKNSIQEDTTTDLDLALVLGDSLESGQIIEGEGTDSTGKESVLSMTITVPEGVKLSDNSGDSSYIKDLGNNTYTITDSSRLGDISLTPPLNFSGELTLSVETTIIDRATCVDETDTQTKVSDFVIQVEPVADTANLTVNNIIGDEDSYISLSALQAELIDQDGSENMSLSITGVPTDAVLVIKDGDTYQLLPNNGTDGGTFDGNPTYEWQVEAHQLADVYLLPPLDYSGDIALALEAITQEIGTFDIRYTTGNFTVGVNPIGDDLQFFDVPTAVDGKENDAIEIATNLESQETDSDEYIQLTVIAQSDSDASALVGLNRIRVGNNEAKFLDNGDGTWSAALVVTASTLASFELFAGDAFGELKLTLEANTIDQQVVLGNRVSDEGDTTSTSVVVNIQAEADAPELTLEYESIISEATGNVPLGLTMAMINPVLGEEGEIGELVISGLPDNLTLTHGTLENGVYTIAIDDVENLAIQGGFVGAQDFTLALEAQSTLANTTVTAPFETLKVSLLTEGTTLFSATDDNDAFVFNTNGLGSFDTPTTDTIA
ncbi:RTX toxin, partial [Vibrio sp. FNV 38]|nr:RTX toxin [Vibrio sp. FNV 38]